MKIIAIDQGTTGTKGHIYDENGRFEPCASFEHRQIYPQPGWVEHDAEELLRHVQGCLGVVGEVNAIGLANQGETVLAWDAHTGVPVYHAIVWQDQRTQAVTAALKAQGHEALTLARAGLPLDPYFSASKMRWLIDHVDEAQRLLKLGRLRLGTSDAFFMDRLCGTFVTDVSTASRTSLMRLDTCSWDADLCDLFGVPMACLPSIQATTGLYGRVQGVPITASVVDQQAALFGHGCAQTGDAKITFGTGAFALALTGNTPLQGTDAGLLPTVAWKLDQAHPVFALDGGVYNAASAVNWLRSLGLFQDYAELNHFGPTPALHRGLVFVPALSGLACPHWDRKAAGLWIGLRLDTRRQDLLQSVLEGVALRAAEVVAAMERWRPLGATLSVDGGMAHNPYFLQFLADALQKTLRIPASTQLTALGTARLAMLGAGVQTLPRLPDPAKSITPGAPLERAGFERFSDAVGRAKAWRADEI